MDTTHDARRTRTRPLDARVWCGDGRPALNGQGEIWHVIYIWHMTDHVSETMARTTHTDTGNGTVTDTHAVTLTLTLIL